MASDQPIKKRRLISGQEVVFRNADGSDSEESEAEDGPAPGPMPVVQTDTAEPARPVAVAETAKITILEDD